VFEPVRPPWLDARIALETRFRRLWLVLTMGIYVGAVGVLVGRIRFDHERTSVLEPVAHPLAAPARPPDGRRGRRADRQPRVVPSRG